MSQVELEGEVVAEEDAGADEQPVSSLPLRYESDSAVVRGEVRSAAIAAAGGVLAGAATVAAVRAVGAAGVRKRSTRKLARRNDRPTNVIASRSFLVDVHLLGR